jgi:hypothetical protein
MLEPGIWLFYYFFQTARFKREIERDRPVERVMPILRLALPLFLGCFVLSLIVRMLLYALFPNLYDLDFPPHFFVLDANMLHFWLDNLWVTAFCIIGSMLIMLFFGFVVGITICIAVTLASGICIQASTDIVVALSFGLLFGTLSGLTFVSTRTITRRSIIRMVIGIVLGIVAGCCTGIFGGFWGGMIVGIVGGQAVGPTILGSVGGGLVGGLLGADVTALIMKGVNLLSHGFLEIGEVGRRLGLTLSGTLGVAVGIATGDMGLYVGIQGYPDPPSLASSEAHGLLVGVIVGITFAVCYALGYCRLLFYPISAFSIVRAYRTSRSVPVEVFARLRRSSLYWDERVLLPLPFLTPLLFIALERNDEITLAEIAFIVTERPTQIFAAKHAALEIALRHLEMCSSLREIAGAAERLSRILPPEMGLVDPQWVLPFVRLHDVSLEATRYYNSFGLDMRREALETMLLSLAAFASRDDRFNNRLQTVVSIWRQTVQLELADIEQLTDANHAIRNPFIPGKSVVLNDSRFVGRHDLARQLAASLSRDRSHPVFLLNGERHMGKSSLLMNLSQLLGAHFIVVIMDMQRSTDNSITVFFSSLATSIWGIVMQRGIRIKKLKYAYLQEASEQNAAAVYRVFDRWLSELESELEREEKVLLLAFDEYESFELAGQLRHFNLKSLLIYFQSIIQHSQRIVLLFSGLVPFAEMQDHWEEYFADVQTFKVSFLQPQEAHHLITHPGSYFPGEQVFGEDVVQQILHVTACHPFFIQGVCSTLIEQLNSEGRFLAIPQDVALATSRFLDTWWDRYFLDLWQHTDNVQRACLMLLKKWGNCDMLLFQQETNVEEARLLRAMDALLRRDMIRKEQESYSIAIPLLQEWVARLTHEGYGEIAD